MIRSTVNVLAKTIARDAACESQSIELGLSAIGAIEEQTETTFDALVTKTSPIHSNEHWDGTSINR